MKHVWLIFVLALASASTLCAQLTMPQGGYITAVEDIDKNYVVYGMATLSNDDLAFVGEHVDSSGNYLSSGLYEYTPSSGSISEIDDLSYIRTYFGLSSQTVIGASISIDSDDNIYFGFPAAIFRRDHSSGTTTYLARSIAGCGTYSGDGGQATAATFCVNSLYATPSHLYITDAYNNSVYQVDQSSGIITRIYSDATHRSSAGNFGVSAIIGDNNSNLYVGDNYTCTIHKIDSSHNASTFAGEALSGFSGSGNSGSSICMQEGGSSIHSATSATYSGTASGVFLPGITGMAFSKDYAYLYFSEYTTINVFPVVRRLDMSSMNISLYAGNGQGANIAQNNVLATTSYLLNPAGVATNSANNLFINDARQTYNSAFAATGYWSGVKVVGSSTATTTTVTTSNSSVYSGSSVTFTSTVVPVSGSGTPTGTVTFYSDGVSIGTGTLSQGSATLTTSTLSIGSHAITAMYASSGSFVGSTSSPITQTITLVPTGITPTVPSGISYGGTAVMPFVVTAANGQTPTGTVTVTADGTTLCTVTLSNGAGTCSEYTLAAGTHSLKFSYGGTSVFDSSYVTQSLKVNYVTLSIAWSAPSSVVYGTALSSIQLNATETPSVSGTWNYSPAAGTVLSVGTHILSVVFTPSDTTNYTTPSMSVQIVVTAAPLLVSANNQSRAYGGANPALSYSLSGFVSGESASVISGAASCATTATPTSPVGSYPITCTQGSLASSNYAFSFAAGKLTVLPATLTISASNVTKTYGDAYTLSAYTASGLVNSDSVSQVSLSSSGTTATASVGNYPINIASAIGSGLANYSISYVPGTLTISPAALTITATNATKTYGASYTLTGYSVSSMKNADAVASVVLTSAGTVASASVGSYPISVSSALGTGLSNYSITYVQAALTVTAAQLVITPNAQTKVYGTAFLIPATAFSVSGLQNSDAVASVQMLSPGSDPSATVAGGPYVITASGASGSGLANYAITYNTSLLTILKAPVTVTIVSSRNPSTYGDSVVWTVSVSGPQAVPTGSVSVSDGATTLDTIALNAGGGSYASPSFDAGTHTLVAAYSGDSNYY
jgi:mucin-19